MSPGSLCEVVNYATMSQCETGAREVEDDAEVRGVGCSARVAGALIRGIAPMCVCGIGGSRHYAMSLCETGEYVIGE